MTPLATVWPFDKHRAAVFGEASVSPNPPANSVIRPETSGLQNIPDHQQGIRCKAPRSDTTEPYGAIRRKRAARKRGEQRSKATPPFDFAQDREPVERPVELQMMPRW